MSSPSPEEVLARLVEIRDAAGQRAYISSVLPAPTLQFVEALSSKIRETCPKDPPLAEALAETNLHLASQINTPVALAFAARSRAQALYTMRRCAEAQPFFEQAVAGFSTAGLAGEAGRTLVTEMDNLSYLGRYSEAIELEKRARPAIETENDTLYLTNLEIGLGNLYYRLNQYTEALAHYDKVRSTGDNPISLAAAGMGRAHVLTDMNRFDEAIAAFEATQQHCEQHGLALWADIADRGISRMHFLRGNYSTALRMVERVRQKHEAAGDARRVGLCDMDRAEIYLQLNLFDQAATLARRASEVFQRLDNRYEGATCLMFLGIAEFKQLKDSEAEKAFVHARDMFTAEGNEISVAAVDLWRAQLCIRRQQFAEAQELASHAAEIFGQRQVPVRAADARVLSAQSWQQMDDTVTAMAEAEKALHELEGFHAPWVSYQAHNTLGRLRELDGRLQDAEDLYLRAIAQLESLRGNIRLDELRMSFGKDKYQVYENIVGLKLARHDDRSAFEFVERSKSRTLIDLLERNLDTVWDADREESPRLQQVRKLREELNMLYNRVGGVGDAFATGRSVAADTSAKDEIAVRERALVDLLRELGTEKSGWAKLQNMTPADVATVQAMLDPDETLIEYYTVGGRFHAFAISKDKFATFPNLTGVEDIRVALKGLTFQLSKFHLKADYVDKHAELLLVAMQFHLRALYARLIRPLEQFIGKCRRVLIVPHHALHYVPFHALYDGESYFIDAHEVTYGASASVLKICRERVTSNPGGRDLILGAGDERTPFIRDEVAALRELMPNARVFEGAEAREEVLREFAPSAGKIHIAAHGIFRSDNPMFSSLRLGDSWLNLFDIFNLQLGAELTTLSACETGMSAVCEGDELLGLARGFLYAGTPSLVVSLWMVNDRSTAHFMRRFYKDLQNGASKSAALRAAMLEVKTSFPHPYYWAPFILLGKS